jgi:hypothetical protein
MRIIALRPVPIANALAIVYAVCAVIIVGASALLGIARVDFPFGVILPFFHLGFTLHTSFTSSASHDVILCGALILSYAVTGWISGLVLAIVFNLLAKRMGGVGEKYFQFADDKKAAPE